MDWENPHNKLPVANNPIALISTTFRPKTSLSRPYKICILVFAIKKDVPTHDTSLAVLNSRAIVGNGVETLAISKNDNINEIAKPKNTTRSWEGGVAMIDPEEIVSIRFVPIVQMPLLPRAQPPHLSFHNSRTLPMANQAPEARSVLSC